jgi:hypothetical protein
VLDIDLFLLLPVLLGSILLGLGVFGPLLECIYLFLFALVDLLLLLVLPA